MGAFRTLMTFLVGAAGGAGAVLYLVGHQQGSAANPPSAPRMQSGPGRSDGGALEAKEPPPTRAASAPLTVATEPVATEPVAAKPVVAKPVAAEPVSAEPVAGDESLPQGTQDLQTRLAEQEQLISSLREELAEAQSWQARVPRLARFVQISVKLPSFKAAATDAAIAMTRMPSVSTSCQDLADVNGIGAGYEQRLYAAGVGTFWELAHLTDADFERILHPTSLQRTSVDPEAIRADAVRRATDSNTIGLLWSGETPDDLEPIKGIGKVFEQRLYDAGIRTYQALATSTVEELATICHSTMKVQPDYADWIAQAQVLAAQRTAPS